MARRRRTTTAHRQIEGATRSLPSPDLPDLREAIRDTIRDEVATRSTSGILGEAFMRGIEDLDLAPANRVYAPFLQNVAVFRGVKIIADTLSRVPFELWRGDEQILSGPMFELFRRPNRAMNWRKFVSTVITQWHTGQAFVRLTERNSWGLPSELLPIASSRVRPRWADQGDVYDLTGWSLVLQRGGTKFIPPEDMLRFEYAETDNPYQGVGPYVPLKLTMDSEYLREILTKSTLGNGGTPGSILTYKGTANLPKGQREKLETMWNERFGNASRASRTALLTGDWEYQILGRTFAELQLHDLAEWNLLQVARGLALPPSYLGFYLGGALSDAGMKVEERKAYQVNFIPTADRFAEILNEGIIHPADPTVDGIFNFDNVEALRPDMVQKATVAEAFIRMGATFHQVNERFDLGFDTTDKPWQNEQLVNLGMTTARAIVQAATVDQLALDAASGTESLSPEEIAQQQEVDEEQLRADQIASDAERDRELADAGANREPFQPEDSRGTPARSLRDAVDFEFADLYERGLQEAIRSEIAVRGVMSPQDVSRARSSTGRAARPHVDRMDQAVRRVVRDQKRRVIDALFEAIGARPAKRAGVGRELLDQVLADLLGPEGVAAISLQMGVGVTEDALMPEVEGAYLSGVDSLRHAGVIPAEDLRRVGEARVAAFAATRRATGFFKDLDDKGRLIIHALILNGINEGLTIGEVTDSLDEAFLGLLNNSRRIARTETTVAINTGRFEAMRDTVDDEGRPRIAKHIWITRRDGDQRESHDKLHGEVRAVGEEFKAGLKYPGDPDAPADETINCRCSTAPVSRARLEAMAGDPDRARDVASGNSPNIAPQPTQLRPTEEGGAPTTRYRHSAEGLAAAGK